MIFEGSAERSVRRSELVGSPSRSVSPAADDTSDDVSQALQARLRSAIELDFIDVATPTAVTDDNAPAQSAETVEEETFAFKLFATLPTSNPNNLTSPTTPGRGGGADAADATLKPSDSHEPNAVQYISLKDDPISYPLPTRRLSYYIASPASALEIARFASSALSTADVLRISKAPRPGLACPWRVINIPAVHSRSLRVSSQHSQHSPASSSSDTSTSRANAASGAGRKRLGKKSRIKARKGLAAREAEERERVAEGVRREEHIREKKTRMNRAKQARKREKERARMRGEGGGGGAGDGGDEGEG